MGRLNPKPSKSRLGPEMRKTKYDIVALAATLCDLPQIDVMRVFDACLFAIRHNLMKLPVEGQLQLKGFGIFRVKVINEKRYHSAALDRMVYVRPRRRILFWPSRSLKSTLKKMDPSFFDE